MSDANQDFRVESVKSATNYDIVSDNMLDIAEFTVEKFEFEKNMTLSKDERQKAIAQIREALWRKVEELNERRKGILENMFILAKNKIGGIVKPGN